MGRWEPDAQGRLERAAERLWSDRGFEETTVADIAAAAGLTSRTFFRYFDDKRDVLFSRAAQLQEFLVEAVADAPAGPPPFVVVVEAFAAAAEPIFERHRAFARERQKIILTHPDLQERQLTKHATLTAALADALRARGVDEPVARLAAGAGVSVFHLAFGQWVRDEGGRRLCEFIRAGADDLRRATGSGSEPT